MRRRKMKQISKFFIRTACFVTCLLVMAHGFTIPAAAQDAFEPDATAEQSRIMVLNNDQGPQHHDFHTANDQDWVKFYALKDEVYTIRIRNVGAGCDVVAEIYGTDGETLLVTRDVGVQGEGESVDWTCPADGIYFVKVKPFESVNPDNDTFYDMEIFRPHSCETGVVAGRIANSSDTPVSGVLAATNEKDSAISDVNGDYRIIVCETVSTLTCKKDGYTDYSNSISVGPQEIKTLNITMNASTVLSVTPLSQNVSAQPGQTAFEVSNTGSGVMQWTAAADDAWLTIESGASGNDSGAITVSYTANSGDVRTGSITIDAGPAANSPLAVQVVQDKLKPPTITVDPASHDYGELQVEDNKKRSAATRNFRKKRSVSPIQQLSYEYIENQVIVKKKAGSRSKRNVSIEEDLNASVMSAYSSIGAELWHISETVETAILTYWNDPEVEFIEPNYKLFLGETIPDDAAFNNLWGLHNTGQENGTQDADIDGPEAWDIQKDGDFIVAVVDTGVDYTHPDLTANMWRNDAEIPDNGVDDDGNGYVDDYLHGWDFANKDNDPMDDHSHGSHVAGTICGVSDNGVGIGGVMWSGELMALKFLNRFGQGDTAHAVEAIEYAVRMGAKVINNSWGGDGYSDALYAALQSAAAQGVLITAASANNYGRNIDLDPIYPAAYHLDLIVSVASTDRYDNLSDFSNMGLLSVDLAAPGSSIFSSLPGGAYGLKSGTSMATPHVSGAAALVWSAAPHLTAWEVKETLLATVDSLGELENQILTGGRLNLHSALMKHKQVFKVSNAGDSDLTLGDISIQGQDAALFQLMDDTCSQQTLESGARCSMKVLLTDRTIGAKSAWISILSNDPVTPEKKIPLIAERVARPVKYTLRLTKSGAGEVTVNGASCNEYPCYFSVDDATEITLEASPAQDFSEWAGDYQGNQNPAVMTVDRNLDIMAMFGEIGGWSASFQINGEAVNGVETLSFGDWQALGDDGNQTLVNNYQAIIGVEPTASTNPSPPAPPKFSVKMDIFEIEGDQWNGPYFECIQAEGKDLYRWTLALNPHGNVPPPDPRTATLVWNPGDFYPTGYYRLKEGYAPDGEIVIPDMRNQSSYDITGGDTTLFLTVEFSEMPFNPQDEDVPGDMNQDDKADLTDAVIALKILADIENAASLLRSDYAQSDADIDKNYQVGLQEVIYILQKSAGLR